MKFENTDIWQRAVKLSTEIYKLGPKIKDYGFKDQLTRSGLSIPSNIAEGFERESVKESINFLRYAKASAGELYTQLLIGKNVDFLDKDIATRLMGETKEIAAILGAIIVKRKNF